MKKKIVKCMSIFGMFPKLSGIIAITFLMTNCQTSEGTICVTFDDMSVKSWYEQRELFKKYNIKCTFFITTPYLLNDNEIAMLKQLEEDGHEIGCHGFHHIDATNYSDSMANIYIEEEILPALEDLGNKGFNVTSFAYPKGGNNPDVDESLKFHFSKIRKTCYAYNNTKAVNKPNAKIVYALGLDKIYQTNLDMLEALMLKTQQKNAVLVLYAHYIGDSNSEYSISSNHLEKVLKISKCMDLKSISMSEI